MPSAMKTVLALAAVGAVQAAVVPTAPGPKDSFNEGSTCTIKYNLDTTGTWKNMTIELMTGSNTAMVHLEDVVTGVDGTTGDGTYSYPCPNVTPNSAIYFYQFTNNGEGATWTTRFTIASSDGKTTDPTESTQPGGQAIPWGTGRLASGSSSGAAASGGASSGGAAATGSSGNATLASTSGGVARANSTGSAADASSGSSSDAASATGVSQAAGSRSSGGSSSSSSSSSSSAPAASGTSDTSGSTSGAQKMVAGMVAAFAGVVGVAALVM